MDWIVVAGLMAISLVLCIGILHLSGRISMLEKDIKRLRNIDQLGDMEIPSADKYVKMIEEQIATLDELQKENEERSYNQSYGDPTYTEWIDKDYDSKGVK